jgi:tetratricopeptide (TPR) repeat protein
LSLTACQSEKEKLDSFLESGERFASEEQHREAVIEYRNALKIDPDNVSAHFALANEFVKLRKGEEAYWEFAETVRLDGTNGDARLKLGGLALVAADFDLALEQGQVLVELEPDNPNAYVLLGQALERLDRSDEAEVHYLKAVAIDPDQPTFTYIVASYYARRNEPASAEPLFVRYTEQQPSYGSFTALATFLSRDPERASETFAAFERALQLAESDAERAAGYLTLAGARNAQGMADAAIETLQQGVAVLPVGSEEKLGLTFQLARMHEAQGHRAEAIQLIEATIEAQPREIEPYLVLSAQRGRSGDPVGALEAAERALKVDPGHVRAKLRKAELLADRAIREEGDEPATEEALALVESVLRATPTSADALFVKAKIALAQSRGDVAAKAARSALDDRPNWPQAHFVLATALTITGDKTTARAEAARAVELDPSLLQPRRLLAVLHASLGEHEYALEQGRAYLRSRPEDAETRLLVVDSLVRLGRRDEALEELEKVSAGAESLDVLFAKGRLHQAAGEVDEAYAMLSKANATRPNHVEILRALLMLDRAKGRLQDSVERIDAALAAAPDDPEMARLKASLALAQGDRALAEQSLERSIELDPDNLEAYQQLAALYQRAGRLDEALATYLGALEQQPDRAQLHHFVAVLYEMNGQSSAALKEYEKALALEEDLAQSKNNLAYLLAESGGDLDRALTLAQEAKALMPDSAEAADTLGWILFKREMGPAAVGYLKEAVASMDVDDPHTGLVRHHLAQAYESNDQQAEAISTLEVALAGHEQRLGEIRKQGGNSQEPQEPEWLGEVREMLSRLKSAG